MTVSKKDHRKQAPASSSSQPKAAAPQIAAPPAPVVIAPVIPAEAPHTIVRMRLAPGLHAVRGTETEIRVDGVCIAGGYELTEFNLWVEAWVDVVILRA